MEDDECPRCGGSCGNTFGSWVGYTVHPPEVERKERKERKPRVASKPTMPSADWEMSPEREINRLAELDADRVADDRWVIRYAAMFGAPWYCRVNDKVAVMTRAEAEAEQKEYHRSRRAAGMDDGDIGEIVHADTVDLTQADDEA